MGREQGSRDSMQEVMKRFSVGKELTPATVKAILEKVARLDTSSLSGLPGVSGDTLNFRHGPLTPRRLRY